MPVGVLHLDQLGPAHGREQRAGFLPQAELAQAVAAQEPGRLVKVPGIGKKTAERLLLELKGKLAGVAPGALREGASDVIDALVGLGYHEKEARAALKGLPSGTPVTEAKRCPMSVSARSDSVRSGMVSDVRASVMIGVSAGFSLA